MPSDYSWTPAGRDGLDRRDLLRTVGGGLVGTALSSAAASGRNTVSTDKAGDPPGLPAWRVSHTHRTGDVRIGGPAAHDTPEGNNAQTGNVASRHAVNAVRGVSHVNVKILDDADVAARQCGQAGRTRAVQHRFVAVMTSEALRHPTDTFTQRAYPADAAALDTTRESVPAVDDIQTFVRVPREQPYAPSPDCGPITFRLNNFLTTGLDFGTLAETDLGPGEELTPARLEREVDSAYEGSTPSKISVIPTVMQEANKVLADVNTVTPKSIGVPTLSDVPVLGKAYDVLGLTNTVLGAVERKPARRQKFSDRAAYTGLANADLVGNAAISLVDFTVTLPVDTAGTVHVLQHLDWKRFRRDNLLSFGSTGYDPNRHLPNRVDWAIAIPPVGADQNPAALPGADRPTAHLADVDRSLAGDHGMDALVLPSRRNDDMVRARASPGRVGIDISADESPETYGGVPTYSETTELTFSADPDIGTDASYQWLVYKRGGLVRPAAAYGRSFSTVAGLPDGGKRLEVSFDTTLAGAETLNTGGTPDWSLRQRRSRFLDSAFGPGEYAAELRAIDRYGRVTKAKTRFRLSDANDGVPPTARIDDGPPPIQGTKGTFDASGSTSRADAGDPGGIAYYDWHVERPPTVRIRGDAPGQVRSGGRAKTSFAHRFDQAGPHLVRLVVYDVVGRDPADLSIGDDILEAPYTRADEGPDIVVDRDEVVVDVRPRGGGGDATSPDDEPVSPE